MAFVSIVVINYVIEPQAGVCSGFFSFFLSKMLVYLFYRFFWLWILFVHRIILIHLKKIPSFNLSLKKLLCGILSCCIFWWHGLPNRSLLLCKCLAKPALSVMCSECATFSFALVFAIIACLWLPLLFHGLEKRSSFLHASTCLQFPLLFGSLSRWYPGPAFNRKWPLPLLLC